MGVSVNQVSRLVKKCPSFDCPRQKHLRPAVEEIVKTLLFTVGHTLLWLCKTRGRLKGATAKHLHPTSDGEI